jgi:hypothetical protein
VSAAGEHGFATYTLNLADGSTLDVTDPPHTDGPAAVTTPEWNEARGEWELVARWIDSDEIRSVE